MKNKKNTIRLTESELKRMIVESAKNIISELDWKTYQNARRKANEKGEYDRALKFGNAAQKEFNKTYGEEGVSGDIFLNRVSAESDDYPSHTLMRMYNYDEEGNYSNPYNYDNTKAYGIMDKYDKDGRYKRVKNPSLKRFFNNPQREKAYKDASKEMDNYVMGNYDYTQGKGWHLPESIISKAINESFKSIIKEQNDQTWRGVKGTFVTEDGYVEYKGKRIDYDDLEDWLYEEIQEYTHNTGERYIEGDVLFYTDVIDAYVDYME